MEKTIIEQLCDKYDFNIDRLNEILYQYNEKCAEWNYDDNYIYNMQEFDDVLYGYKPSEVASEICSTGFNPCDDYFTFTAYGCESSDFLENLMDCSVLEAVFEEMFSE